jgi:uroporphyrinogen decarboxylase
MNARERVLKTLDHEEPDRVPYSENLIKNPNTAQRLGFVRGAGGVKFKPEKAMAFLGKIRGLPKFMNKLIPKLTMRPKMFKPIIKFTMKEIFRFYIHIGVDLTMSPIGPTQWFRWVPPNYVINEFGIIMAIKNIEGVLDAYYLGGILKNEKIYDNFPRIDPEQPLGIQTYISLLKGIKNDEILVAPAFTNGFFDSTYMGMGIEAFSKALAKNPSFIKRIVSDKEKAFINLTKKILDETHSEVFFIGDDLAYNSGPFISPRNFKKFFLPSYQRLSKVIRKRGAKLIFHTDGDIRPLLNIEGFIECYDAIHPWQVSANMDIFEAKEKYRGKLCIMGNVPVAMLVHKTQSEISEYVKKLLRTCAPGGGYMLSSGNSIVTEIPADNYLAMLLTYRKYRNYPINIP